MRLLLLASLVAAVALAQSQEPPASSIALPTPAPAPSPRVVRLHFAPPPIEGTISLGIYDARGKLVRVLHREDDISDFTPGHDALETTWDGNDDAGNPLPAARYLARGYLVGDVQVEGVDYFFNDWVTDETSPHFAHITKIEMRDQSLLLAGTTADGKMIHGLFDPVSDKFGTTDAPTEPAGAANAASALIDPVDSAIGKDGTIWGISHLAKGSPELEILQLAANTSKPAALRKLAIAPGDPQPIGIAASRTQDRIFLLEESPAVQRVRSLTLLATAAAPASGTEEAISDWKVDFEKKIVPHQNFTLVHGKPEVLPNEKMTASEKVTRKLRPNPLERDHPGKVDLAIGFDSGGSFLRTSDGLPLRTVSDNPAIKRAFLVPQGDQDVEVFQDDGAVVEQFRISRLDQMMAFDCGDFELK